MKPCPTCGHLPRDYVRTALRRTLAEVGPEWVTIRTGASRWLKREMERRYPDIEFRHTRHGDAWTIEARRAA